MADEARQKTGEQDTSGSNPLINPLVILLLVFPLVCVGVAGGIRVLQRSMGIQIVPYIEPEEVEKDPVQAKIDSLGAIRNTLTDREKALVDKATELAELENQLTKREKDVAAREQKVEASMARLAAQRDSSVTKHIAQLAKLYEAMRPEETVSILKTLDETTTVRILRKMKQRQVVKVLAMLTPERAAELSGKMSRSD